MFFEMLFAILISFVIGVMATLVVLGWLVLDGQISIETTEKRLEKKAKKEAKKAEREAILKELMQARTEKKEPEKEVETKKKK